MLVHVQSLRQKVEQMQLNHICLKNLDTLIEQSLQNKYANRQVVQSYIPNLERIKIALQTNTNTIMQLYIAMAMNM